MAEFSKEQGLTSHQPPILPLTGLRFVAAIFVCMAHTTTYLIPQFSYNVERIAAEGMTLFFVLSGFVIHYNYSHAILS